MSYKDEYHPRVKSDLKKLDREVVREFFRLHIENILHEPNIWERLHGDLEGVYSYHFRKNRVDYRAAYTIEEAEKIVYILMVGKRESFYDILKRRMPYTVYKPLT